MHGVVSSCNVHPPLQRPSLSPVAEVVAMVVLGASLHATTSTVSANVRPFYPSCSAYETPRHHSSLPDSTPSPRRLRRCWRVWRSYWRRCQNSRFWCLCPGRFCDCNAWEGASSPAVRRCRTPPRSNVRAFPLFSYRVVLWARPGGSAVKRKFLLRCVTLKCSSRVWAFALQEY